MIIAITSGYFNPIHPGHIECFRLAKEQVKADHLCVIINNDFQAALKRGVPSFQNEEDRFIIVESIKWVDKVFLSIDKDLTVCATLKKAITFYRDLYPEAQICFVKGGDRFASNTPEKEVCDTMGISLIDGLGAKTHHSSSYVAKIN